MVFSYIRDAWNYYFGNRYPGPSLVLALKERSDQTRSTAVVPYRESDLRIIRQPSLRILRPIEEDEKDDELEEEEREEEREDGGDEEEEETIVNQVLDEIGSFSFFAYCLGVNSAH